MLCDGFVSTKAARRNALDKLHQQEDFSHKRCCMSDLSVRFNLSINQSLNQYLQIILCSYIYHSFQYFYSIRSLNLTFTSHTHLKRLRICAFLYDLFLQIVSFRTSLSLRIKIRRLELVQFRNLERIMGYSHRKALQLYLKNFKYLSVIFSVQQFLVHIEENF